MSPDALERPAMPTNAQPLTPTQPIAIQPRPRSDLISDFSPQTKTQISERDVLKEGNVIENAAMLPSEGGMRVLLVEDNEV